MCEVLDRIENRGRQAGIQQGMLKGRQSGLLEGRLVGRREGRLAGENDIRALMQRLFAARRYADAERAANDKDYCAQLLKEFGLTSDQ